MCFRALKKISRHALAGSLGLLAGVMLYFALVSCTDLWLADAIVECMKTKPTPTSSPQFICSPKPFDNGDSYHSQCLSLILLVLTSNDTHFRLSKQLSNGWGRTMGPIGLRVRKVSWYTYQCFSIRYNVLTYLHIEVGAAVVKWPKYFFLPITMKLASLVELAMLIIYLSLLVPIWTSN